MFLPISGLCIASCSACAHHHLLVHSITDILWLCSITSDAFLAEIVLSSPRQIFIFIIKSYIFWIKVSKKTFDLILNKASLSITVTFDPLFQSVIIAPSASRVVAMCRKYKQYDENVRDEKEAKARLELAQRRLIRRQHDELMRSPWETPNKQLCRSRKVRVRQSLQSKRLVEAQAQHLEGRWRERVDRKSTRLNSSHLDLSRMPSSA